jgi:capsular polysaccharide biosynthesis protein
MEEISLTELFLILRKRIQIIILITIISIVTSAIVSFFILDPQYQTFTTLMVGKPKDYQSYNDRLDYNEVLLNQKLVSTYGELVKTRAVADEVIRNLNLDISYETFKDKVNVNLVKDTEIIRLEVIDEDPELAVEIANETAEVFMKKVRNIMRVENIQVIDEAQIPDKPVKPKPMLNMAIAGVLGLMIGVFITFLLEFLDNTIKTPDDVKRHLELPVIGTIPMVEEK